MYFENKMNTFEYFDENGVKTIMSLNKEVEETLCLQCIFGIGIVRIKYEKK